MIPQSEALLVTTLSFTRLLCVGPRSSLRSTPPELSATWFPLILE